MGVEARAPILARLAAVVLCNVERAVINRSSAGSALVTGRTGASHTVDAIHAGGAVDTRVLDRTIVDVDGTICAREAKCTLA